LIWVIKL